MSEPPLQPSWGYIDESAGIAPRLADRIRNSDWTRGRALAHDLAEGNARASIAYARHPAKLREPKP